MRMFTCLEVTAEQPHHSREQQHTQCQQYMARRERQEQGLRVHEKMRGCRQLHFPALIFSTAKALPCRPDA